MLTGGGTLYIFEDPSPVMRSHKPLWGPIIWVQRPHIQERSSIQAEEKTEENILDAKRSSKLWFRNIPVYVTNYSWEDISDRVWICIEIRWWWHPVATYQSTLIILLKTYQSKWFILFNRVCNKPYHTMCWSHQTAAVHTSFSSFSSLLFCHFYHIVEHNAMNSISPYWSSYWSNIS